ncbi:MAG TPA: hypothetical protein PLB87_10660, partial [Prolixibacteraceae bacterium]|nr:hypothetical protein [Prolixibacteraceae bacterium]
MNFWEEEIETLQRPALEKLQVEKLNNIIGIAKQSTYYQELYNRLGISPGFIQNIGDITKLP